MERKAMSMDAKVSCVALIMIMVLARETRAVADKGEFKKCMKSCLLDCIIPPWTVACPPRCLLLCLVHRHFTLQKATHFCTAGCATSLCSKFITKHNYNLDEVEGCVDGCSVSCNNNYVPQAN